MIPVAVQKHYFTAPDGGEVAVCAPRVADCLKQLTGDGEGYRYSGRTESLPYEHALQAAGVAGALGPDWTAEPMSDEHPSCNWFLKRADGLTLYMNGPAYHHRKSFEFGLSAPRHNGHFVEAYDDQHSRVHYPSIGCGETKTPAQMAKDIQRRLLADAVKVDGLVRERIAGMVANDEAQMMSWRRVHVAFGKLVPDRSRNNGSSYWNGYFDGGSFEVHNGGNVTFKLHSVAPVAAVALAKAIKALRLTD